MSDPYLLRLELLKLSQDILDNRAAAQREKLHMEWDATPANMRSNYPEVPSVKTEDVIEHAQLLNEFISRKS